MMKDNDVIVVIFGKEQVRHCKVAHFLKQFGRDALPEGPALAALMNRFRFLVHGYDDDPQELYAIPEVRKFYQHFHRVWPYWFYFCEPTGSPPIAGCRVENMLPVRLSPRTPTYRKISTWV